MGAHPGAPDMVLEIRDWKSSQEGPAAEGNVEGSGRSAGQRAGRRAIIRQLPAFMWQGVGMGQEGKTLAGVRRSR